MTAVETSGHLIRDQNVAPSVLRQASSGQTAMMNTYRTPIGRASRS